MGTSARDTPPVAGESAVTTARHSASPPEAETTVSLIIPTLNEARGIRHVLAELPSIVRELIIVDGASSDGTSDVVRKLRPDAILLTQSGKGKGDALKLGIRAASSPIVVTMDADGSMDTADIHTAVDALIAGAHFVKGSRLLPGGGSSDFTWIRRLGNRFLTKLTNALFSSSWTDITYGFNAYWTDSLENIDVLSDGFGFEIQAAVRARRAGLQTCEIACYEAPRIGGMSKLKPFRDGWKILIILFLERRSSTPLCFNTKRIAGALAQHREG